MCDVWILLWLLLHLLCDNWQQVAALGALAELLTKSTWMEQTLCRVAYAINMCVCVGACLSVYCVSESLLRLCSSAADTEPFCVLCICRTMLQQQQQQRQRPRQRLLCSFASKLIRDVVVVSLLLALPVRHVERQQLFVLYCTAGCLSYLPPSLPFSAPFSTPANCFLRLFQHFSALHSRLALLCI